jgi:hypothetical protein
MKYDLRRVVRLAVWAVVAAALPAAAVEVVIPRIGMEAGLGSAAPAAMSATGLSGVSAALSAPALTPSFAPSLPLSAAPLTAAPLAAAPAMLAAPAPALALAPAAIPHAAVAVGAAPTAAVAERDSARASAIDSLHLAAASDGPRRGNSGGGRFFDGSRSFSNSAAAPSVGGSRGPSGFIQNADGVWVGGRVAEQSVWINKMQAQLAPHIDLGDVLNVMDDAYDEARVKLKSAEKAAVDRKLAASSVHLEGTRNWVDAILEDVDGLSIAVHTHRVYFHPAPGNPASEISEGIRRASKYLDKAKEDFAAGGHAETDLNTKFKQVVLNFDTRGYKEIEAALRVKEAEIKAQYGDRFVFNYITEPRMASKPLRAEYNRLVEQYKNQPEGLMSIIDGVTYSRTVGVGHELNSHLKRMQMGLTITQAGKDFFGKKVLPDGRIVEEYKTEFDAVTEPKADAVKPSKDRDVVLWEDKSARVWMPLDKVMEDTFLYKLKIYRENRAIIEESLGGAPLKVAFSVDVGGLNRRAAKQGVLVWKDVRQQELMEHLKASEASLSKEYGFPVSFIFVNSHPGENSDLFYQTAVDEAEWVASQKQGGDRKHAGRGGQRRR